MRWPRSVTLTPMGLPSRSLKLAMLLRALATTGFCPVTMIRSLTAASSALESVCVSDPTPMLTTTFLMRGTCITFLKVNSRINCGTISFW